MTDKLREHADELQRRACACIESGTYSRMVRANPPGHWVELDVDFLEVMIGRLEQFEELQARQQSDISACRRWSDRALVLESVLRKLVDEFDARGDLGASNPDVRMWREIASAPIARFSDSYTEQLDKLPNVRRDPTVEYFHPEDDHGA